MRSSSRRFQRTRSSGSAASPTGPGPAGASRSARTSRAAGSVSSRRVSARLAADHGDERGGQARRRERSEPVAGVAAEPVERVADGARDRRCGPTRSPSHPPAVSRHGRHAVPRSAVVARLRVAAVPDQHRRSATSTATSTGCSAALRPRPRSPGCDLAVFPELAITGYPPEDLLLKPGFVADNRRALDRVAAAHRSVRRGRRLRRRRPRPLQRRRRVRRRPGAGRLPQALPAELRGVRRAALLRARHRRRAAVRDRRRAGGRVDLRGRVEPDRPDRRPGRRRRRADRQPQRLAVLRRPAGRAGADAGHPGRRRVVRARLRQPGRRPGRAGLRRRVDGVRRRRASCWPGRRQFAEDAAGRRRRGPAGLPQAPARPAGPGHGDRRCRSWPCRPTPRATDPADRRRARRRRAARRRCSEVYEALVLGTRDYVRKNGFTDVVIGLSGGIDSSLVAVIAVDALGAEHVHGVLMPSRYSTRPLAHRRRAAVRRAWASSYRTIPIEPAHAAFLDMLAPCFAGPRARPHRGEPAEPHPGRAPDGAVQQVRLAGADHRQQERDGRRATRRSTATRPAASPSSRTCPRLLVYELCRRPQRAGPGATADPRGRAHQAAVGRAAPRPARRPVAAALRGARPDPRGLRRGRPHPGRARRQAGFDADAGRAAITRLVDLAEYKRRQTPAGRAGHAQGVRQGPAGSRSPTRYRG